MLLSFPINILRIHKFVYEVCNAGEDIHVKNNQEYEICNLNPEY